MNRKSGILISIVSLLSILMLVSSTIPVVIAEDDYEHTKVEKQGDELVETAIKKIVHDVAMLKNAVKNNDITKKKEALKSVEIAKTNLTQAIAKYKEAKELAKEELAGKPGALKNALYELDKKIGKAVRHSTKCGKIITAINILIALEEMQTGMDAKCVKKIKSIERDLLKVIKNLVNEIKNDKYLKYSNTVDKIIKKLKKLLDKCNKTAEEIDELIKKAKDLY